MKESKVTLELTVDKLELLINAFRVNLEHGDYSPDDYELNQRMLVDLLQLKHDVEQTNEFVAGL